MADVLDVQVEVLNFREEARGCLHLAQAEELPEVRTVLMRRMSNICPRNGRLLYNNCESRTHAPSQHRGYTAAAL